MPLASQAAPTASFVGGDGTLAAARAAEAAFVAGLGSVAATERFEGFAAGTRSQPAWSALESRLSTSAGTFSVGFFDFGNPFVACRSLSGGGCLGGLAVLDQAASPFSGRFATSGSNWLDSADYRQVSFRPGSGADSVGFYITDPNDQGGRFSVRLTDGSQSEIDFRNAFGGAHADGRVYYLGFHAAGGIEAIDIFTTAPLASRSYGCGGETPVARERGCGGDPGVFLNDGFGIDDVTVGRRGQVPEPMSLALLGLGAATMGLAARRRVAAAK